MNQSHFTHVRTWPYQGKVCSFLRELAGAPGFEGVEWSGTGKMPVGGPLGQGVGRWGKCSSGFFSDNHCQILVVTDLLERLSEVLMDKPHFRTIECR